MLVNSYDVKSASNICFSNGNNTVKSTEIIQEYEQIPYVTDPVGKRHLIQGRQISEYAHLVPMVKVATDVMVKDSKGNNTTCAIYKKSNGVNASNENKNKQE
jgi:hypothetical protein